MFSNPSLQGKHLGNEKNVEDEAYLCLCTSIFKNYWQYQMPSFPSITIHFHYHDTTQPEIMVSVISGLI
jgi:hypothetical protein